MSAVTFCPTLKSFTYIHLHVISIRAEDFVYFNLGCGDVMNLVIHPVICLGPSGSSNSQKGSLLILLEQQNMQGIRSSFDCLVSGRSCLQTTRRGQFRGQMPLFQGNNWIV